MTEVLATSFHIGTSWEYHNIVFFMRRLEKEINVKFDSDLFDEGLILAHFILSEGIIVTTRP